MLIITLFVVKIQIRKPLFSFYDYQSSKKYIDKLTIIVIIITEHTVGRNHQKYIKMHTA